MDDRARLLERRARLDARLKTLALADRKQKRRDDARRKIIAGAVVLETAGHRADFAAELHALLNRYVTRPQDRVLFDFLKDRVPDVNLAASPASASFTEAAGTDEKSEAETG